MPTATNTASICKPAFFWPQEVQVFIEDHHPIAMFENQKHKTNYCIYIYNLVI